MLELILLGAWTLRVEMGGPNVPTERTAIEYRTRMECLQMRDWTLRAAERTQKIEPRLWVRAECVRS
jgi:hypothetical protein